MKTAGLALVLLLLAGCATRAVPDGLVGTWFDWRLGDEVFVLRADGTGEWRGASAGAFRWTYDPRSHALQISDRTSTAPGPRLLYNPARGMLIQDDGGMNAERVKRGEPPYAMLTAVNDRNKSPMPLSEGPAAKRPQTLPDRAPPPPTPPAAHDSPRRP